MHRNRNATLKNIAVTDQQWLLDNTATVDSGSSRGIFNTLLGSLDLSLRSSELSVERADYHCNTGYASRNAGSENKNCTLNSKKSIRQHWKVSDRARLVSQSEELQKLLATEVEEAGMVTNVGYKTVLHKFLHSDAVEQELIKSAHDTNNDKSSNKAMRRRSTSFEELVSVTASNLSTSISETHSKMSRRLNLGVSRRSSKTSLYHDNATEPSPRRWSLGMRRRSSLFYEDSLAVSPLTENNVYLAGRRSSRASSLNSDEKELLSRQRGDYKPFEYKPKRSSRRRRRHSEKKVECTPVEFVQVDFDPQDNTPVPQSQEEHQADKTTYERCDDALLFQSSSDCSSSLSSLESLASEVYDIREHASLLFQSSSDCSSLISSVESLASEVYDSCDHDSYITEKCTACEFDDMLLSSTITKSPEQMKKDSSVFYPWPSPEQRQQEEDDVVCDSSNCSESSECGWLPWPTSEQLSNE